MLKIENVQALGFEHAIRGMVVVYLDIVAPLYWWKEFDTYKIGTVTNSCSTMHKIQEKGFTLDDFSHEHLFAGDGKLVCRKNDANVVFAENIGALGVLNLTINMLNMYRTIFLNTNTNPTRSGSRLSDEACEKAKKELWWQMIQLLPSSYNQRRTVMLNYEVLAGLYQERKNHKLDEWHVFCDWVKSLPYSELITGEEKV